MKTSKEAILDALRIDRQPFPFPDLSAVEEAATVFENPLETFCASVKAAGGKVVSSLEEALAGPEKDVFVAAADFAVAENGALWISGIPEGAGRRDLFIHEKLVLTVQKDRIVNNMHEAYRRLGERTDGYGIFISGPSKTADIEQALVFGAHGSRELAVVIQARG